MVTDNAAKLPPQNLDAERGVLGSMLLDREAIGKAREILSAPDFYMERHQIIFRAVLELSNKREPVDYITLTGRLSERDELNAAGGASYLTALTDGTPTAAHVEHYARIVKDTAARRAIIRQAAEMAAAAHNGETATDQTIENTRRTLAELSRESLAAIIEPPRALADGMTDFLQVLADPPLGYQSGFPHLDALLHGLRPGVFILAAPPSAGKTTLAAQLAGQVCENGRAALFFSWEQSAGEILSKSIARQFRLNNEAFHAGKEERAAILAQLQGDALAAWKDGPGRLKVIEADARHTAGIIRRLAEAEKAAAGESPLIVLDYLQIIPDPGKYSSTRDKVDALISELRRLARDLGAPIIAISSMARSEYERASLAGFKESGGIEYGADVAAVLEVESESGQTRNMSLTVLKHRGGRRAKIFFTYDLARDTFTEQTRKPEAIDYRASLGAEDNGGAAARPAPARGKKGGLNPL